MNFQKLRIIRETVRRDFNLTEVAQALCTSQPGVSKHIKELEDELGVELFIRRGKRLLDLTEPGRELMAVVERILVDAQNMQKIADHFSGSEQGRLRVATTHTQARYALPMVIKKFRADFPKVHLALYQGSPKEIAAMVVAGEADIAIATETLYQNPALVSFPCYSWHHAVIVPQDHPLCGIENLTLEALAEFPLITYQEGFTGRSHIDEAFAKAGLVPDIVLSAIDADVIKTYVEVGLGIGIIASMAYIQNRDQGLFLLNSDHLFQKNTTRLAIRRGEYLRGYTYRFIESFAPHLNEELLRQALLREGGTSLDENVLLAASQLTQTTQH